MTILGSGYATNCSDFLDQAPQPPSKDAVKAAMDVLYDVGAIERISDQFERLTPLGRHLAKLPVNVKVSSSLFSQVAMLHVCPVVHVQVNACSVVWKHEKFRITQNILLTCAYLCSVLAFCLNLKL